MDKPISIGCVLAVCGSAVAQYSFLPLPPYPAVTSGAGGLSGNGAVAVGSINTFPASTAARWVSGQPQVLGSFGVPNEVAYATSASHDGTVVVGYDSSGGGFLWTLAGGYQHPPAGFVPGAVSGDGLTLGGSAGANAAIWRAPSGTINLGVIPGTETAQLLSVSQDGNAGAGVAVHTVNGSNVRNAIRWRGGGSVESIAMSTADSRASGISPDGAVTVGYHHFEFQTPQAFRLTSGGVAYLGNGEAIASSRDGWVICGNLSITGLTGAFVWDPVNGTRNLQTLLQQAGVPGLTGWTIRAAVGISHDGTVVAGNGTNPQGQAQAFIATIPQFCYSNCDGSTASPALNVLDFNCFLNRFTAGLNGDAPAFVYANCNNDGGLNVLDFNCFLNKFVQGCP